MQKQKANNIADVMRGSFNISSTLLIDGVLVGVAAGCIAIAYRICLSQGEKLTQDILLFISNNYIFIFAWFAAIILLGLFIGRLLKWEPMIAGSGVPQITGEMKGYFHHNWLKVLLSKFLAGVLCILGGLSLGRGGPLVQLGSMAGIGIGKGLKRDKTEEKYLISCGASAGLAAAFNTPLAGVMFSIELMHKSFSKAILVSVMAASLTADFVSKNVFGFSPIFQFHINNQLTLQNYWLVILLGIILGALGAIYNKVTLYTQKLYGKMTFLKPQYRIVIPFLAAGILGIALPQVLGGGGIMIDLLEKSDLAITTLFIFLIFKFIFSIFCSSSGAPGGIFFPLLVIGAYIGAIYGKIVIGIFGLDPLLIDNFIIIAMAGYFSAIVRAPITGIILTAEMTGSFSYMLSLGTVSIIAYFVAYLLKSNSLFESLLNNMPKSLRNEDQKNVVGKMLTEIVVHQGAFAVSKKISEIKWPQNCLLVSIRRDGNEIIPKGDTEVLACDTIVALVNIEEFENVSERLHNICEEKNFSDIYEQGHFRPN